MIFTRTFWTGALERALKTAGQVAVVSLGAGQMNVFHADWRTVGGVALGGAVLSVLTSLAGIGSPAGRGPAPSEDAGARP